jgi:hypothetical protein
MTTNDTTATAAAATVMTAAQRAVAKRHAIEKRIARRLVQTLLKAGYLVSVYDGGAFPVKRSNKLTEILAGMFSTDIDTLKLRLASAPDAVAGFVQLVYGNDGYDVISDYSTSLDEPVMNAVNAYVDRLETKAGR